MVPEPQLLILAAEKRELAGIPAAPVAAPVVRFLAEATLNNQPTLLAANGPGRSNAAAALTALADLHPLSAVVSVGYVGALDPSFAIGDIVIPSDIRAAHSKVEYPVSLQVVPPNDVRFQTGRLVTIDRVAQTADEKRTLARDHAASAVDMEASAVFETAQALGLPAAAVRVVSDRAEVDFPFDFNRARRPDGTFSGWKIVRQAGWKPYDWRRLLQLKRDADVASRSLTAFLSQCRFQTQ